MGNRRSIHIVFVTTAAVLPRLIAAWFVGHRFHPKVWEYETLARNMLSGQGYIFNYREYGVYKALLSPGYSLLTWLFYRIFGVNHPLMVCVQIALMAVFSVCVYLLTERLFEGRGVALFAGIMAALHPGLVYYSVANLHQLNLYMPLFYGAILLFCLCHRSGDWKTYAAAGVVSGMAVLTRATFLPIAVLSLAVLVFLGGRSEARRRAPKAALALALLLLVNLPWAMRNYHVLGSLVFSQTNKWEAFWVGNNPAASGGHQRTDGTLVLAHKPESMRAEIAAANGDELAVEAVFKKYAFKYVRERPADFVAGLFKKGAFFWWFYPHTGITYPKSYLIVYKVLYSALLVFAIAGLLVCWRRRLWKPEMLFPAIFVLGIWAAHTLNFMEMRHRWTVEPILLILASVAVSALLTAWFPEFGRRLDMEHAEKEVNCDRGCR